MEAIDLDVWIFMPAPQWAPTVMVFDNDLEQVWIQSCTTENDGNTGDTWIFRQVQASRRIIALCPVFLYCTWQLCLEAVSVRLVLTCPSWGASTPPFISKGVRLYGR
jgi:hypothetical protein